MLESGTPIAMNDQAVRARSIDRSSPQRKKLAREDLDLSLACELPVGQVWTTMSVPWKYTDRDEGRRSEGGTTATRQWWIRLWTVIVGLKEDPPVPRDLYSALTQPIARESLRARMFYRNCLLILSGTVKWQRKCGEGSRKDAGKSNIFWKHSPIWRDFREEVILFSKTFKHVAFGAYSIHHSNIKVISVARNVVYERHIENRFVSEDVLLAFPTLVLVVALLIVVVAVVVLATTCYCSCSWCWNWRVCCGLWHGSISGSCSGCWDSVFSAEWCCVSNRCDLHARILNAPACVCRCSFSIAWFCLLYVWWSLSVCLH